VGLLAIWFDIKFLVRILGVEFNSGGLPVKNILASFLVVVFSGCATIGDKVIEAVNPGPIEKDMGCCLLVNLNGHLSQGEDGSQIIEFQVILDQTDPYYSMVSIEIDIAKEIPVISNNCLQVIEVTDEHGVYYKAKTIPKDIFDYWKTVLP
jgi:hypothetical protein